MTRPTVFASIVLISSQKLSNPLADHQLKKAEKSNQLNNPICFVLHHAT
jgi:hypothetical protein